MSKCVHRANEEVLVTVRAEQFVKGEADAEFDLDITLIEMVDPAHLINMTDDGCGQTCEKSTCISAT
ncbi:FxLD family lantipeptide [Thermomonospora umbrina]|uniref:FxLD family lantipeptide n=1 Tax=Thermomonospora umbrina TaxID=111806 RepID=A0A3D9T166_9ACTN|nr:FxLD family lantipeptide [Thermomonospora umbrina]